MRIGYARISTTDQTMDLQNDALAKAGCERVFHEVASGARADRPVLAEAMRTLRAGDSLVVYRLDRLARSLSHLLALMEQLDQIGVGFHSVTEAIDTSTAGGRLVFGIFGAVASFERDLIVERTRAGLDAARQRGRIGGRPKVMTAEKKGAAIKLLAAGSTAREVSDALGVSIPTLYRHLPAGAV